MEWFESWFDSPYYPILYRHRNEEEAQLFIHHMLNYLQLEKDAKVLDLACGRGRHSKYLSENNLDVVGMDLSPQSIAEAKPMEKQGLKFLVGDMREIPFENEFQAVFNLFTSFGYFQTEQEHLEVFRQIKKVLKPNGIFVFDFLNVELVRKNMIPKETKTLEGVDFEVSRIIEKGYIKKKIKVQDQEHSYQFEEQLLDLEQAKIIQWAEKVGFEIRDTFGDYNLSSFDIHSSPRLIIVFAS